MSSELWQRIQLLFEEARAQPAIARRALVESACSGDVQLRDEVLSLLAVLEQGGEVEELPSVWLDSMVELQTPRFAAGESVAGRYLIRRLLGRGGMGEVYEAWDEELSITIALKTLHIQAGNEALHRLKREGLLARSVSHPNVCRVYDLGTHGEGKTAAWFLTMELLRGDTLEERLLASGRFSPAIALPLAQQMAAGLGAAHQAGVVHRDFKTGNVMLVTDDAGEQAVVTDFGMGASEAATEADRERQRFGTLAYMAPEQVRGEQVGPEADIYALGVVLYEMVTGTLPFTGDSAAEMAKHHLEDVPSPRSVVPALDEMWESVILRCLDRDPRRRFGFADDVAIALAGQAPALHVGSLDPLPRARHTLPAERDTFVGRHSEIEELRRHLAGDARVLTLVGAGGMGKTRLAVRYGWQSVGDWPGGVWFCDLTEARSLDGIASAMAGPLRVELGRGDPIEKLGHAVAGRGTCLIVLDNFEQIVGLAAKTVGRWVEIAPQARFLVTSRERLGLGDRERTQGVEPLSLEQSLELFEARARWLRPGLRLIGPEIESAREIVRLADGMPLAIELAAARMRVMSAAQIATQMRKRFQLLTGGRSARHETIAVAIDSSWELLSPWERAAWAKCAVFEGGFTLEAAEGVLDLSAWPGAPWVVDVMQSLLEKSLLRSWAPRMEPGEGSRETRFGMYVSLHEYARMKLQDAGSISEEGDGSSAALAAEKRHGSFYARYGTQEQIDRLDQHGGMGRRHALGRELDNLLAACKRALDRGDSETALAVYRAASQVLFQRGPLATAVKLGRDVLAMPGQEHRVGTLFLLGWAELISGHMEEALRHLEAALHIYRELGDRGNEGVVSGTLAILLMNQGRIKEAHAHYKQELAIDRELHNRYREGIVLLNLGQCYRRQGQMEEARAHFEAALALCREVGNRRVEGMLLNNLGQLHRKQGRMEEARAHLEAALAIDREVGSRLAEGNALNTLGCVYVEMGDLQAANTHFEAALTIHREIGSRFMEGVTIGNLGHLHFERGRMDEARAQYDSALAICREVGNPLGEGEALAALGTVHLRQGRLLEARAALNQGEAVVRSAGGTFELGLLLCARAELEHRSGDIAAARATLSEAEAIAVAVGAGQGSEIGRKLAQLRQEFR
jgi:serine/threonine protein kinase/predicted ATPase/Tfp pilus assembly protein PilF